MLAPLVELVVPAPLVALEPVVADVSLPEVVSDPQ
jgi:hypothetical protein